MNLLSEGIIKADGTPGKNFSKAAAAFRYRHEFGWLFA